MKKFKSFTAGLLLAGTALCISPAVAFSPIASSVVMAEDDVITVEAGEAFEINAAITTDGYTINFEDSGVERSILSEETYPGDVAGTTMVYAMIVIDSTGTHQITIEDGNGSTVKTVSVNVTETADEEQSDGDLASGTGAASSDSDTDDYAGDSDAEAEGNEDAAGDDSAQDEPDYLAFIPITNGTVSGKTESGEFKPGEKITLSLEADKGYVLSRWVVRTLDGRDVSKDLIESGEDTFTLPEYPVRISAELNYNLIHEIELLDVTEKLEAGKPVTFTGHVKDKTDSRFFLLAEIWINEFDTKGITNSDTINKKIQSEGTTLIDKVDAGDKYNYSVLFMTTEGYEFADDVKLIYNGKEYEPVEDESVDGKTTVAFSGFLSFGEQTNERETKTTTRTVTHQETKSDTVTQYVYNTYTYTTYQYVTRVVPATAATGGTVKQVAAAATGDKNTVGVWIALAIAAGGGVVSGILVGRRRKRK